MNVVEALKVLDVPRPSLEGLSWEDAEAAVQEWKAAVRAEHRRQIRQVHPDVAGADSGGARDLNDALRCLLAVKIRKKRPPPPPPPTHVTSEVRWYGPGGRHAGVPTGMTVHANGAFLDQLAVLAEKLYAQQAAPQPNPDRLVRLSGARWQRLY